jgi:DHA1 family bicyclomycin/chloramphenicol resistance-like MFS transporter
MVAIVVLLGSLTAFGALSIDMYLPAMPSIAQEFRSAPGVVERTLAAFLVGLAAGQLFFGPLSDRVGRRLPLIGGLTLYTAASIACAFSASAELMTFMRFLQGIGACAAIVISRAIVRDLFDHTESARVFSLIMLVFGLAPILAPLLGSIVLEIAGWRAIFALLAAFGACVLAWVSLRLKETRSETTASTARGENPLAALTLLARDRRLLGYMLAGALNSACLFTYISASPSLLMGHFGVGPTTFAWLFGMNAFGLVAASQVNRALLTRHSPDRILGAACLVIAGAGVLLLVAALAGAGLAVIMALLFSVLSSFGFIMANANAGALSIDPQRAGSISALLGASGFAVGAAAMLAVSVLGTGSPLPMAAVMCTALFGAAAAYWTLVRD